MKCFESHTKELKVEVTPVLLEGLIAPREFNYSYDHDAKISCDLQS